MSQEEHKKHSLISDTDTKRDIRKKGNFYYQKDNEIFYDCTFSNCPSRGDSLLGITLKEKHNQLIQLKQNLFHLKLNKAHLSKSIKST